jgi:hypothetical protein
MVKNRKHTIREIINNSGLSDAKIAGKITDPETGLKWGRARLSYHLQKEEISQEVFDLIMKSVSSFNIDSNNNQINNSTIGDMQKSQIAHSTIHDHSQGVPDSIVQQLIDSLKDQIKYLQQTLTEKDVVIGVLRTAINEKDRLLERFENKSGEGLVKLFAKLDDIFVYIKKHDHECKSNHGSIEDVLVEHKEKTWTDLEEIKDNLSKKKKTDSE